MRTAFEITTVANWRLKQTLEESLKKVGIKYVIMAPYSNAYSGYITTPEEYQVQDYEGGHNVFGQYALYALKQKFSDLAHQLSLPFSERSLSHDAIPPDFSEEEIEKIKHFESLYAKKDERKAARLQRRLNRRSKRRIKKCLVKPQPCLPLYASTTLRNLLLNKTSPIISERQLKISVILHSMFLART